MSIDVDNEQLITLAEASRSFPGRPICLQTIHRWRLTGVRGAKLETCLIGGIRWTSTEAVRRFIARQNAPETPAPAISSAQRAKQSAAARKELAEMGV